MRLLRFRTAVEVNAWRPVHDRVMGGVSSGRPIRLGDTARFEGDLSLDNNGGFASFRADKRLPDLTLHDGIRLQVRGDGQVYKLSLRTDGAWDGVAWQAPFATVAGKWTAIDLAFEDLVPTWRGRLVPDVPAFDRSRIRQVGILIADKQEGPFELEIESISAWRASGSPDRYHGTRAAVRARTDALATAIDEGVGARNLTAAILRSERLLVISAPSSLDTDASLQYGHLLAWRDELAARDLRVVNLMGARTGRLAGRTLTSDQVQHLRQSWTLPAREWCIVLVDKSGDVAARWSAIVSPERLFEHIDAVTTARPRPR